MNPTHAGPRRSRSAWIYPVLFLPALATCADRPQAAVITVSDSAGVTIIEHGPLDEALAVWSVADSAETTIGRRPDEPPHLFSKVIGAVRLSDGRIVVGDELTREARYFDPRGEHLLTVGGQGEGPGELRFLYAVDRMPGDTVVLGGWPIGYRYWFDQEGRFLSRPMLGPWFPGQLGRTLPDGSLLLDSYPSGSLGNEVETWIARGEDPTMRPRGVVERVDRLGRSSHDTIAAIVGAEYLKSGTWPGRLAVHTLPSSTTTLVTWDDDQIYTANTGRPEIRVFGYEGGLERLIRWEVEPVAVTSADRDAFRQAVIARLRNPAQQRPHYERWLSDVEWPEVRHAFDTVLSDQDGRLWIKESAPADADPSDWLIFGTDGRALARVELPGGVRVLFIDGTHLVGTSVDDLDVPTIRVWRLNAGPG